ncbi:MAG: putative porin [Bacteroidia bacterium]|nr:putative porin [Bacteroidia bacterium]
MRRRLKYIFGAILLFGGMLPGLMAQVYTDNGGEQVNFPGDPGFSNINLAPDTSRNDTGSGKKIKIKPNVKFWDRDALFLHQDRQYSLENRLGNQYKYDEIEWQQGFIQSLGQSGKPFQVWRDGVKNQNFILDQWKNPILNSYNDYIIDGKNKAQFIDTRTPYVNVLYMQGPDRLQTTDVTVSRNINPFLNTTFYIQRRLSESAYRDMVTDHLNLYLSANFHAFKDRYHAFAVVSYNLLNDAFNGGIPKSGTSNFLVQSGDLITDRSVYFPLFSNAEWNTDFNGSFFKSNNAPLLDDALRKNRMREIYLDHQYELIPLSDSAKIKNRLTLRNEIIWEINDLDYSDASISTSNLEANLIPVYASLDSGSNSITEDWLSRRFKLSGMASYSLQTKGGFQVNVNGGLDYQVLQFVKDTTLTTLNSTDQIVNGSISFPLARIEGHLRQRFSDRFSAERDVQIKAHLEPWTQIQRYKKHKFFVKKDSLGEIPIPDSSARYRPVSVDGAFTLRDMNPSLFQTFFVGDSGNAYVPNRNLTNQLFTHTEASIRYDFPVKVGLSDTLLPMYAKLRGFFTRIDNPIYYNSNLEVVQDMDNGINWIGLEASFRLRFWRKFYLENTIAYQIETASADNLETRLQEQSAPNWYGNSSLFYENNKVAFAQQFRAGIDLRYFGRFAGQTIDPISTEYFATNYEMTPYFRAGLFAVLKLRGVYVWGRVQHVNEFLLTNGYFTTPFYPMLERVVSFGVNWSFYN